MKIALLIAGYLRGFYENIDKIKENIIQNHECDIYIHITEEDTQVHDKYFNKKNNIDFIKNEINPKLLIISKNINFDSNYIINNLLNQHYKYYWLNEEKNKLMELQNIKYDIVMKLRPDVYIFDKLEFNLNKNFVYIPIDSKIDKNKLKNNEDNSICDIMAYGDSLIMDKYFNFYIKIKELINDYGFTGETLLYYYLNNNNIFYKSIDINYMIILSLCNTIAITGDSGSGKSTISNLLKQLLKDSFILECDRYHKWERKNINWKNMTHLNPEANYLLKMEKDVFDLKIGNNIYQVDYDHKNGNFTDKKLITSSENIIVCGLHSFFLPDKIINLKIYLDTDDNLKIPWKIIRDIKQRGHKIEYVLQQIESRKLDYEKFIKPQRENADIIISFYTNKVFTLNTFNIDEILPIFLKIGIKDNINLCENLPYAKSEIEDNFIFFYFENTLNYNEIIKLFIIQYSNINKNN
jgi:uridine kinase